MDFSATRMVVMTVIFVELYERKQIFFFPPSSDLCRCLLKTTVNTLAGMGMRKGLDSLANSVLTVCSALSLGMGETEVLGVSLSPLIFIFFLCTCS